MSSDLVDVTPDGPHVDWDPNDRESHMRRLWAQAERAVASRDHLLLEAACAGLRRILHGDDGGDGGSPRDRECRSIPARYEYAGRGRPYRPADTEDDGEV